MEKQVILFLMKYGIPDLCRTSRIGNLSGDQINWVEHQLRHLPYFQLHQIILAHQEHQVPSGSPCIEKGLLFSTNRKAMAALMIQDPEMDLFIPSPENKITEPTENPEPALKDIPAPQPVSVAPPTITPAPAVEVTPEPPAMAQTFVADTVETPEATESQTFTPQAAETPEAALPAPVQEAEPNASIEAPVTEAAPAVSPEQEVRRLSLSAAEQKLDHKIKFRLQMFGWKIAQIRKQLEVKASHNTARDNSAKAFTQDERILSAPNLTWVPETDWLKEEITGSFDPELPEPETIAPVLVNNQSATRLPAFIEVEYQPFQTPESNSQENTPDQVTGTEEKATEEIISENPDSGIVTLKHNQLLIDIQIGSSDSGKWLKKKPVISQATEAPKLKTAGFRKRPDRSKVLEIIDKFIESEPEISIRPKLTDGKQEDISRRSVSDEGELVSETLAQIYLKQGNKTRAIRIYENLKLKFPEKSAYFESLLQKIS